MDVDAIIEKHGRMRTEVDIAKTLTHHVQEFLQTETSKLFGES
jgi:hypothetical protein